MHKVWQQFLQWCGCCCLGDTKSIPAV